MKKLISVAVILLFIGLAFAPSINANISKEDLVEFTTEVCGLNGGKQTIKLTQQQADEVESLFDSIREQLNTSESREQAEKIFKDAVVELDKYGLLGGLSVKQAQRLVLGRIHKPISGKIVVGTIPKVSVTFDDNENLFCLLIGKTSYTTCFQKPIQTFFLHLGMISYFFNLQKMGSWFLLFWILPFIILYDIPLGISLKIGLGICDFEDYHSIPARGWIITFGLNGKRNWNNTFYGHLPQFLGIPIIGIPNGGLSYPAVIGYTGLKILTNDKIMTFSYLGSALWMKLGSEPPEF